MSRFALLLLLLSGLFACTPSLDDDDSVDDDDATADDDDTTGDDDDATMDDDDATMDDDDTVDDDDDIAPCGLDDLRLDLVVSGDFGPGNSFDDYEEITLTGVLTSGCPFELSFQTNSGCLLEPWTLTSGNTGEGRGCDDAITSWTVAQGGTLEDVTPMGTLSAGQWTWTAGFMDQEVSTQFQINEIVIGVQ